MSSVAQLKAKFRTSKVWKLFRKQKMDEQNGKDPITNRKLYKGSNLHHKILTNDIDVYRDLSVASNFIMINKSTHEALHWALDLIKHNGLDAWKRYIAEVEIEAELNHLI